MAFLRMAAVGFDIEQVVDDVSGRCGEAEAGEGDESRNQPRGSDDVRQQQRKKDEQILCPLVWAQRFENRAGNGVAFFKARGQE